MSNTSCCVCDSPYDLQNKRPLLLPCGHSFCSWCLRKVASKNPRHCPLCRERWDRIPVQSLQLCRQLVAVKNEKEEKNHDDLCKNHGLALDFWCEFDYVLACKKCLNDDHKNCHWVLIESKLETLDHECVSSKNYFTGRLDEVQNIAMKSYSKLQTVNSLIEQFVAMRDQIITYLDSVHSMEAETYPLLTAFDFHKEKASAVPVQDRLVIFKDLVSLRKRLDQLLNIAQAPEFHLSTLVDMYEVNIYNTLF